MLDSIPFNMSYTFGEDLREVPEDAASFTEGIGFLEQQLAAEIDPTQRAEMLSLLGTLQRITGRLEASLENLEAAQDLLKEGSNEQLKVVNSIRLGTTLQFQGRHPEATALFAQLETKVQRNASLHPLLDFIYQHTGKNHLEAGDPATALSYFEKALELRHAKGKPALVASSEWACRMARKVRPRILPTKWMGSWQDKVGKTVEIEGLGKGVRVTFRGGPMQSPFPLRDVPGGYAENLEARLEQRDGFPSALVVEVGVPEVGPKIKLEFLALENGQWRAAHFSDPIDMVSMRPSLLRALVDDLSPTHLSWASPLFNYVKNIET